MKRSPVFPLALSPAPSSLTRRQAVRASLLAATAVGLSMLVGGCGFKLRGGSFDMAFKTVQLVGFAGNSPMATELARALEASGVEVVDSTLAATQAASAPMVPSSHIVLEAVIDKPDVVVSTTTSYGQIRDMTVRNNFRFRVKRGDGSDLILPSDVSLARDMTYNEKDALAKQDEAAALHRAMQSDIVNQVMRRLAAIRPGQLATPPEAPAPGVVHAASAPALPTSAASPAR